MNKYCKVFCILMLGLGTVVNFDEKGYVPSLSAEVAVAFPKRESSKLYFTAAHDLGDTSNLSFGELNWGDSVNDTSSGSASEYLGYQIINPFESVYTLRSNKFVIGDSYLYFTDGYGLRLVR